jgi:hypothetical protein
VILECADASVHCKAATRRRTPNHFVRNDRNGLFGHPLTLFQMDLAAPPPPAREEKGWGDPPCTTKLTDYQLKASWGCRTSDSLGTDPLKIPAPTVDRDQTVSRRFKPSSRNALIGEQPNPWDLLQPQDAMSRHRGAKPPRRCELITNLRAPPLLFGRRPLQSNYPPGTVPNEDNSSRLES